MKAEPSLIIKSWNTGGVLFSHDKDEYHHKSLMPGRTVTYPFEGKLLQAKIVRSSLKLTPDVRPIVLYVGVHREYRDVMKMRDPEVYECVCVRGETKVAQDCPCVHDEKGMPVMA